MQETITILWNGGWDDYIVDTENIIDDPGTLGFQPLIYPEYLAVTKTCVDPHYLRTRFSSKLNARFPGKAVRVIQHLGGGD